VHRKSYGGGKKGKSMIAFGGPFKPPTGGPKKKGTRWCVDGRKKKKVRPLRSKNFVGGQQEKRSVFPISDDRKLRRTKQLDINISPERVLPGKQVYQRTTEATWSGTTKKKKMADWEKGAMTWKKVDVQRQTKMMEGD